MERSGKLDCAEIVEWRPFPVDAIPQPVGRYIQAAGASIGCDPAFVALPLLSAIAGAVGTSTRIELKPDWHEPSILWTGIVGDSGTHKSPSLKAATRFADSQDARGEIRAFRDDMAAYDVEQQRYETELKVWQRKPSGSAPEKPVAPTCKRFSIADVTIEALADRLADNPRGVLIGRDELAGWLDSFNQYKGGRGADTAAWLSIHNAGSLRVDRRGGDRKTIFVQSAAVSITGGIQPPVLRAVPWRSPIFKTGWRPGCWLPCHPRHPGSGLSDESPTMQPPPWSESSPGYGPWKRT